MTTCSARVFYELDLFIHVQMYEEYLGGSRQIWMLPSPKYSSYISL